MPIWRLLFISHLSKYTALAFQSWQDKARPNTDLEDDIGANLRPKATVETRGHNQSIFAQTPMLFIHVHKAAGTTICRSAKRFETVPKETDTACNWVNPSLGIDDCLNRISTKSSAGFARCEDRARYMHQNKYTYSSIERGLREDDVRDVCFNLFRFATFLREPAQLAISASAWDEFDLIETMEKRGKREGTQIVEEDMLQFPLLAPLLFVDNYVIRTFLGRVGREIPIGRVTADHAEQAIRLLERFLYVGIVEHMGDGRVARELNEKFKWQVEEVPKSNVHRNSYPTLNATIMSALQEMTKHDRMVYDHFARKRTPITNF
jgi:hypothetical protein